MPAGVAAGAAEEEVDLTLAVRLDPWHNFLRLARYQPDSGPSGILFKRSPGVALRPLPWCAFRNRGLHPVAAPQECAKMNLQTFLLLLALLPPMKKTAFTAGLLTAASLFFGPASHAQVSPPSGTPKGHCSVSGLGGTAAYDIAALVNLGSDGCFLGDKLYYDFSFDGITSGLYTFTLNEKDHTFSGAGLNFTGTSFEYDYKVALYNPVPGQQFLSFNTDASGSATTGELAYSKGLTATTVPLGTVGPSTSFAPGGGAGAIIPFHSGDVGPVAFSSVLTLTNGKIDTITDTLSQKFNGTTVPGPLPILGAGAAFGFSRRLRSRIKQVA